MAKKKFPMARMARSGPPARRSNGSRSPVISSGFSAWQDRLLEFYDANPEFVLPRNRRNEVVSFVKGGLRDLSISRTSFKWGIPVPGDADHIMYVWFDALTNYITAAGYPDTDSEHFKTFWPATVHVVGKDIPSVSCGLLARLPDGGGCRPASAGVCTRVVDGRGTEDVQVVG